MKWGFNELRVEGSTTYLLLTGRQGETTGEAIIDTADLEYLKGLGWRWCITNNPQNHCSYVISSVRTKDGPRHRQLHRTLFGWPAKSIDHINNNGLDNRRSNLRAANKTQQQANTRKPRNNTSGYKGVSWHKASQRFAAQIGISKAGGTGRSVRCLGYFVCPIEAARAYDKEAIARFGEFAQINFPDELAS